MRCDWREKEGKTKRSWEKSGKRYTKMQWRLTVVVSMYPGTYIILVLQSNAYFVYAKENIAPYSRVWDLFFSDDMRINQNKERNFKTNMHTNLSFIWSLYCLLMYVCNVYAYSIHVYILPVAQCTLVAATQVNITAVGFLLTEMSFTSILPSIASWMKNL